MAEPEADADPSFLYGGYYGHPGYYGHRHRYIYGYGYPGHHLGKRSANAEPKPEADAEAANYYVNSIGGYYGHGYSLGHKYGYYGIPFVHNGHYLSLGHGYYGHHLGKRFAKADPEAEADAEAAYNYVNSIGGYYGHGYSLGHKYGYYGYPSVRKGHYLGLVPYHD